MLEMIIDLLLICMIVFGVFIVVSDVDLDHAAHTVINYISGVL